MTRDRRLLLLLGLLTAYSFFVAECRYYQREDTAMTEMRHRHRHKHESSDRRNHHDLDRRSWQEVDYEYNGDSEDPVDEDDYKAYYERSRSYRRPPIQRGFNHYQDRMFESPYSVEYHDGHHADNRYDKYNDGRRTFSHNARSHRYKPGRTYHHKPEYSRNRDAPIFADDAEDLDYERSRYVEDDGVEKRHDWWRNLKPSTSFGRDRRSRMNGHRGVQRHRLENHEGYIDRSDEPRWTSNDGGRRSNYSKTKFYSSRGYRKMDEDEDYRDHGELEDKFKEDDDGEDDIWKDIDNEEENEEEVDDDVYKSEKRPPLRTYDDIIKRLTSDDSTTQTTTVKRGYRNIGLDKHTKPDSYEKFQYKPKNVSRATFSVTNTSRVSSVKPNYLVNQQTAKNSTVKFASSSNREPPKNAIVTANVNDRQNRKTAAKISDTRAKTKSLEQDYDEYLNAPDNEKEEDLVKAGVEEDSSMQADYTDDDNVDENETSADTLPTSTITTTTTMTTSTTTSKPLIKQQYDYRDSRAYESGTGAQYNGYQARNDYPPMSAHSVHKWQSLGTRESVKETRSNMQQYNRNGKSAEIREALQHAIKVNKEGSCQWPRARVIPVHDVYPSPSTTYIPHCAILHRCSDDTGCCRSEALTCVPKHTHRVELSFYTTNVGGANVVEKLSFYNHTECECRERTEYETTNEKFTDSQRVYRHYQPSSPPQNMKKPPPRKPCRCPSEFTPRITPEGICQCNCYEENQNCIKTKRGKGYFSLADRICIQNSECAMPNCEFGEYMRRQGKCPRKRDAFDAFANYGTNFNQHRFRS